MDRPSKLWRIAAAVYVLINVAGAVFAIAMGEPMHAAVHAGLLVLGVVAYPVWQRFRGSRSKDPSLQPPVDKRIEYLQQSVDAVALEVERIGEAQRFNEKLRGEKAERPASQPPKKEQS